MRSYSADLNSDCGRLINTAKAELKILSRVPNFKYRFSLLLKRFFYEGNKIMSEHLFTSESVSEGHPDKVADQISDSILDAILEQDPKARVACETMINTGMVVLSGEITTSAVIDYNAIVRTRIKEIGYTSSEMGFDADSCAVITCY